MAQAPAILLTGISQFLADGTGLPLAGGLVYTYAAGTTTKQATFKDSALTNANLNPVVLDANGKAIIYLDVVSYKIDVQNSAGVSQSGYPLDNVAGSPLFSWPTVDGTSGQFLKTDGAKNLSWGTITAGLLPAYVAKTAIYTAVANDFVSCTANTFTVTLPAASSNVNKAIWVANNGTGTITIGRTGSDTVGLATSQTLAAATASSQGDAYMFLSDGVSNWNLF